MAFGSITAALILVDRNWRLYVEMPDQQVRRTDEIGMSLYGYDSGCAVGGDWAFFWYVWAAQAKAFWLLPILGSFIIGFGLIAVQVKYQYNLLIPSFFIHMLVNLDLLPTLPGRLLWYILRLGARCKYCREIHRGSLISLGALGLYADLGLGWGNSVLGFVNVALCAVP